MPHIFLLAVENSLKFLASLREAEIELSSEEYAVVMLYHDTLVGLLSTALKEHVENHRDHLQTIINKEVGQG